MHSRSSSRWAGAAQLQQRPTSLPTCSAASAANDPSRVWWQRAGARCVPRSCYQKISTASARGQHLSLPAELAIQPLLQVGHQPCPAIACDSGRSGRCCGPPLGSRQASAWTAARWRPPERRQSRRGTRPPRRTQRCSTAPALACSWWLPAASRPGAAPRRPQPSWSRLSGWVRGPPSGSCLPALPVGGMFA